MLERWWYLIMHHKFSHEFLTCLYGNIYYEYVVWLSYFAWFVKVFGFKSYNSLWNCCNFRPVHLISWRLLQASMDLTSMASLEISQRLNWGKLLGKYQIICHFHLETLFPCLLVKSLNGRHCLVDLHVYFKVRYPSVILF